MRKWGSPDTLPLLPAETVKGWGETLVVAPHPDDESLGCGGAIALLRRANLVVRVLFVSDGTGSHPSSHRFPAPKLRDLRETEACRALAHLGVAAPEITFFRLPDTRVPTRDAPDFAAAADRLREYLRTYQPATVLIPWRRDPHGDHRASWQLLHEAAHYLTYAPRILEYPIWVWELAAPEDLPTAQEMRGWRLDITGVRSVKQRAIAAHQSQLTDLIDDDPNGFRLTPSMLAHFDHPWEIYLEENE